MKIEVTDNSEKFKEEMQEAALCALEICGGKAEGYAKMLTPVDTGLLRNSITHAIAGKKPDINKYKADRPRKGENFLRSGEYKGNALNDDELCVYIGTNVEYAEAVETGTSTMQAQPYLKPAVADHSSEYREIIENELKKG